MSKSTAPRARVDWAAMRKIVDAQESPHTWDDDYLHAMESALRRRDRLPLLRLLDAKAPMSPALFPILAEVIRDRSVGRPTKLLVRDELRIRRLHDTMMPTLLRAGTMSEAQFSAWIADLFHVDASTVAKLLRRPKSSPS